MLTHSQYQINNNTNNGVYDNLHISINLIISQQVTHYQSDNRPNQYH